MSKKKCNSMILISLSNLLFPVIGFFLTLLYYYITNNISVQQKKILYFNMAFSFAFLGFLYTRINETGDLYRYGLSLYYYGESLFNGRENIISGIYESFYPLWYFLLYLTNKLNLNIQFINFLAGFTIYFCWLYVIYELDKKYMRKHIDKMLVLKMFLIVSFVALFSSYKTLWAFSLLSVGLYFLMNNQKRGYVFIFFGVSIHPVAWIPLIIYMISKVIKFNILYLYISILFGLVFKNFIVIFNSFLDLPFLGSKINTYIYGEWSQYRFQDNSEYVKFFLLVLLILFILYIIFFKFIDLKNKNDKYFMTYNNFILWYFSIALWFVSFRTISLRLILDGAIFFFPFFYQVFLYRKIYKKRLLSLFILLIWIFMIDIRTFNILNDAYQVGNGLPFNIFSSPLFYILEDSV